MIENKILEAYIGQINSYIKKGGMSYYVMLINIIVTPSALYRNSKYDHKNSFIYNTDRQQQTTQQQQQQNDI